MDNLKNQMKDPRAFNVTYPPQGDSLRILKNGIVVGESEINEEDFIMAGLAGGCNRANIERLARAIFLAKKPKQQSSYWGIKDRGETIKVTLEKRDA